MASTTARNKGRRAYRSVRRKEQARRTRERIITAARDAFLASGYSATTMRAVAAAAGVSVKTVELAFGTKRELLKTVVDVAIAGDDQPIPVLQREWAREAEATADADEFLAVVGVGVRTVADRVADILLMLDNAAATDEQVAALAHQLDNQRAATAAWIARGITERAPLRADVSREQATDTIWLLMDPVVFRRLTRDRGWSRDTFQRWFTDSIRRLLLPAECDGAFS